MRDYSMKTGIKCDFCKKEAVWNYQDQFVRYTIKDGDYVQPPVIASYGETNVHVCDTHNEPKYYAE